MDTKDGNFTMRVSDEIMDMVSALQVYLLRDSASETMRYLIVRAYQAMTNDPAMPEHEWALWANIASKTGLVEEDDA